MSLSLHDVTLTYPDGQGRLTVLDRVTLSVPGGSLTAIAGPSGSGKSSLLSVAATLVRPDTGTVVVDGTDTTGLPRGALARLRRRRVGLVFQQPNLLPALTATEQLQVMARIGGHRAGPARARAGDLLDAVGLTAEAGRRPHQLSGGQRQRLNLARALMNDPGVLLVDEPTSALDHERGAAVVDLLVRLTRERSTATVLVTHDRSHLGAADRVVEVRDGRITGAAPGDAAVSARLPAQLPLHQPESAPPGDNSARPADGTPPCGPPQMCGTRSPGREESPDAREARDTRDAGDGYGARDGRVAPDPRSALGA